MKLLEEAFAKGGGGHVRLVPDNPEDMWHVYNLIRVDDHVDAVTFRKVTRGGGDERAGAAESERVRVRLRLRVEDVDYDGEGDSVRVKGRNTTETDSVKLGAYHTITLEPNRPVTIEKVEWDVLDVDRVRDLSDPASTADLAVLLITEGLANLALVGSSVTTFKAKVEKAMPRKSGAAQMGYAKALETFHRNVFAAVERCVDFSRVKCVVVAGPGFAKDAFMRHVDATLARTAGGGGNGPGTPRLRAGVPHSWRRRAPTGVSSSSATRRRLSKARFARFWKIRASPRSSRTPRRRRRFAPWTTSSRRSRTDRTARCTARRTSSPRTTCSRSNPCSSSTPSFVQRTRMRGGDGRRRWTRLGARGVRRTCSPRRTRAGSSCGS